MTQDDAIETCERCAELEAELVSRRDRIVKLWGEISAADEEMDSLHLQRQDPRWRKIVLLAHSLYLKGPAEAVSEIQAELNELRASQSDKLDRKKRLKDKLYSARRDAKDLHKQVLGLVERLKQTEAERDLAQADAAKYREALAPFANAFAESMTWMDHLPDGFVVYGNHHGELTLGHFRRARAVVRK